MVLQSERNENEKGKGVKVITVIFSNFANIVLEFPVAQFFGDAISGKICPSGHCSQHLADW